MTPTRLSMTLRDADATAALARRMADVLRPGDCLLLEGQIGAGKTHFARALIQSVQSPPEDVPSPTFTLVQVYDTQIGEIWHCDLYRLTQPDELAELGLQEAFETAICLIEWPDRLADMTPPDALHLRFLVDADDPDIRHVTCAWSDDRLALLETVFADD